jgi:hypothetical protein
LSINCDFFWSDELPTSQYGQIGRTSYMTVGNTKETSCHHINVEKIFELGENHTEFSRLKSLVLESDLLLQKIGYQIISREVKIISKENAINEGL